MVVNHKMCLYSISFLFARIVCITSLLIYGSWYLLFSLSIKDRKSGKHCSISSTVRSLFVMLYIFCGIGMHCLTKLSIFCMSHCKCYFGPNQIESQLAYRLCKDDDSKLKALE